MRRCINSGLHKKTVESIDRRESARLSKRYKYIGEPGKEGIGIDRERDCVSTRAAERHGRMVSVNLIILRPAPIEALDLS